jgi:predicted membrane protein
MEHLSAKQESFCENAGIFGALIAITCLIQFIIFMISHWISYSALVVYLISIIGFILLARKSSNAFVILVISTSLLFLLEAYMLLMLTVSVILLILLTYSIVMIILMKVNDVQKMLKQKHDFENAERKKWESILR